MIDTSIIEKNLKILKDYSYPENQDKTKRDLNFISSIKEKYIDPYLTMIKDDNNNMRVNIKPGFLSQQQEIEIEKEKDRIALRNKEIKQHEYNQQQLALENYRALQKKIKLEQLEYEKKRTYYPPSYHNTTRNYTPYEPIKGRWIPEKSGLGVYEKGHYVWTGTALGK
jgi:ADP-heptose:LPS heptosyltransferase